MNFKKLGSQLFSNKAVQDVPVLKHLATQGTEGVGLKNAHKVTKGGMNQMSTASKGAGRMDKTMGRLQKELDGVDKLGISAEDKTALKSSLQGRINQLKKSQELARTHADAGQEAMVSGAGDMAKSVGRYFGATDLRGQSGRAMAIGVRGGVGLAGYMGANTALRYVSGGGMTYNNSGERDIAGIPFI